MIRAVTNGPRSDPDFGVARFFRASGRTQMNDVALTAKPPKWIWREGKLPISRSGSSLKNHGLNQLKKVLRRPSEPARLTGASKRA